MKIEAGTIRQRGPFLLGVTLALLLALAMLVWRNPLWLLDRQTDARLRLHGVHEQYTTVDGYQLHFLVGGKGHPVVLVHGLGSRGEDWANLIPQLTDAGYRVYALDLLGYGKSSRPRDADYSIAQQAHIVEGFLNSQHLEKVDLAGWSMGGWIAMKVALAQPERVRRLVLLGSAGLRFKLGFDPSLFHPATTQDIAALEQLLIPDPPPLPRFLAVALLHKGNQVGWVVQRSMEAMLTGQDLVDGRLSSLTMPVLIGWGEQDRLIPLAVGYRLHHEILQSVLDIYSGCGHLAPDLCARQVGPSMIDFLNAQPARMAMVRHIAKK